MLSSIDVRKTDGLLSVGGAGYGLRSIHQLKLGEEKDVHILLSKLDLSSFVELRDAAAILTMYQVGLRHIDLEAKEFQ